MGPLREGKEVTRLRAKVTRLSERIASLMAQRADAEDALADAIRAEDARRKGAR